MDNKDRVLIGWEQIDEVSPWPRDHLRRKYGIWLKDNGYVMKTFIKRRVSVFTWESLIKSGIIRLIHEKQKHFFKS